MFSLPLTPLLPLQPPLALQLDALVVVHDRLVALPVGTLLGLAFRSTVGAATGAATSTATYLLVVPPALLAQVSVNVLLPDRGPRASEPEEALLPLHAPEALHEAA